jgi:MFS family permease
VGPATTYLLESAPPAKRASLTSWQAQSQSLATIAGSGFGLVLAAVLTKEQLYAWGWRLPFLVGVLVAPVALYIRRQLPETIAPQQSRRSTIDVLTELLQHRRMVLMGVFIICGGTVSTYVSNYMTTYALTTLRLPATTASALTMTGSMLAIAGCAVGVWADRFGRKPVLIAWRVAFLAVVFPAYWILTATDATATTILLTNMFLNFMYAAGIGASYAFMAEAFPQSVRSSGLAILYALGVAIFGGTTQFVVAWLIDWTKDPMVPAYYLVAANLVTIVGLTFMVPHAEVVRARVGVGRPFASSPARP